MGRIKSRTGRKGSSGRSKQPSCPRVKFPPEAKSCQSCKLVWPRDVTLVVRNVLREPFFENTIQVNCTRFPFLFDIMQQAAELDTAFRFTAKYFGETLGFFIEAIND